MHTYLPSISKVSSIFHRWLFSVFCYSLLDCGHRPDICRPSLHIHSGQCRSRKNSSTDRLYSTSLDRSKITGCCDLFSMANHLWCQVLVSLSVPRFDYPTKNNDHLVVVRFCHDDPSLDHLSMLVVYCLFRFWSKYCWWVNWCHNNLGALANRICDFW